jgi:membrane protease YdiL (CAAX protease family)
MRKFLISISLFLGGSAVFVLGNPYYTVFLTNGNQIYYAALTLFFLLLSIGLKRSKSNARFWPPAYALFTASAALLFLSTGMLHIVPVILVLSLLVKDDLKSIFIGKGNLKQGLIFGLVSFSVFALITIVIGSASSEFIPGFFEGIHWVLLFIFANAIMEELWLRAIFLKKYEALIGRMASILVTALVFGASHVNAAYEFPGGVSSAPGRCSRRTA